MWPTSQRVMHYVFVPPLCGWTLFGLLIGPVPFFPAGYIVAIMAWIVPGSILAIVIEEIRSRTEGSMASTARLLRIGSAGAYVAGVALLILCIGGDGKFGDPQSSSFTLSLTAIGLMSGALAGWLDR